MKRLHLTLVGLMALAAFAVPAVVNAEQKPVTVILAGGDEANRIHIWLSADGREYVIESLGPLGVGESPCSNPDGDPNRLVCEAPRIGGFWVNASDEDDIVSISKNISIPVTLNGGGGDDQLIGGAGNDLLHGDAGDDRLVGRKGSDVLFGGGGNDVLVGGPGNDVLHGGYGEDRVIAGPGADSLHTF
ncbi:MAG TPA: hypothetical protein VF085_00800 [Solirubrobacterales bacterium]